ncbi:hypothetical protein VNO80_15822 [Phaseolus coccineus]|uniref:NB-ARC domain-containing protein n=1 Tax=Phaseolus coccineus TaxID=3886 RepID=A0AAN9MQK6_PHACN
MSSSHSQAAWDEGKPHKPAAALKKRGLKEKKDQSFFKLVSRMPWRAESQSPPAEESDLVTTKEKKDLSSNISMLDRLLSRAESQSLAAEERDVEKELIDFLRRLSEAQRQSSVVKALNYLSRLSSKLSSFPIEVCAIQVSRISEELTYFRTFLKYLDRRKDSNFDQMRLVRDIIVVVLHAEQVLDSFPIKTYKKRQKGVEYLLDKPWDGGELEWIINRMRKIREKTKNIIQKELVVTVESLGLGANSVVGPALEKLDHILNRNLITQEDVIETVLHLREGYLGDAQNIILSSSNSTWYLSEQSERVWLQEVKDICNYTVAVAEKFIERRERQRRVWHALYPYEQHAMEMNLMEQMEHISTQFGDALYRRWTFGDGGNVVMGDIIGSRSKPLTFTCFSLFEWRSLDHNLKTTRRYLALMEAFLDDIDSAVEGLNQRQKMWVEQLRVVARKGHSLVDAYPDENGFLLPLGRIIFARDINCLLNEIIDISDRKEIYGIANIQVRRKESLPSSPTIQGTEREIIVEVELEGDNSSAEDNPVVEQPSSFSHRHMTELEREFQLIKGEKQLMNALFHDVQEIGYEKLDVRSKIWVDQMQAIDPEIDLVIEECEGELKQITMLKSILESKARFDMMEKIKRIRRKIKDAWRSRKAYGLVEREYRAESLCRKTKPLPIVKESKMVGVDEEVGFLMAQLLSGEKHRCITSIVGSKGTGKTKLARFIYKSKAVVCHFDCVIWVTPSSTVEGLKNKIAKRAAKIIMGGEDDTTEVVLTTLANKKHLIVVDGVQTPHLLDTLREAIPDRLTASRFLLTTRNAVVAQRAGSRSSFLHHLRLLDDQNSWILFTQKLSLKLDSEPKLQDVGKKIVAKCGGLPLEILKMSKLLSRKDVSVEEWAKVLEQSNEGQNLWSETLDTVNTNLPSYLRRCLFYFQVFPADFEIPVRRLVALWVAEGLVLPGGDQELPPELVAERYLTELIDLNMVQIAQSKPNGKVKTCRFPNGLRQIFKSTESRIPEVGTSTDFEAVPVYSRIRRVADHLEVKDIWHKHIHGNSNPSSGDYDSLRTYYQSVFSFMSFDTRQGSKPGKEIGNFLNLCIWNNCLLQLRVLDLEGVYKPNLPKDIAKLSRLSYLGLRWTYLESLSSSITSLLQLQTLDLKHTYVQTLPSSIWKMKLRHLFLSESNRTRFPPKPIGINIGSSLYDLQTLWGVFVDEETPVKGGLDKLVNITKLGITCQSKSSQQEAMESQLDAVADWIVKLQYLQSLRLKSKDKQGRPWKIHLKFLQHHTNLTDLYLLGCLSTPLNQLFLPPTLAVLTLSHSKLVDDPMQILKDAPNLRSLSLLAESYLGRTIFCESESFSQLRVLRVWKLEQLEEWNIEQKALPSLRQLEIRLCPLMKVLPDGLKHVNSLIELKLTNMSMEINTEKRHIPPNCEVHRDDSPQ